MATGRAGSAQTCERCQAAFTSQYHATSQRQATLCRVCATRRSLAIEHRRLTATPAALRRYAANGLLGR